MPEYRAAVIGLGWMGLLYDLASRIPDRFEIEDIDRPTPTLDVHRRIHHHEHPGSEGNPTSYAEAFRDRDEIELVAGVDRDPKRLDAFVSRYGIDAVYRDAVAMFESEKPDLVAVATNTRYRADLTCLAVEHGAKGILTEKPMANTLEEADRMVRVCKEAGVPLCCGSITTTHPSFARAKALVEEGAIGDVLSLEAGGPFAQHQNWSYFLDSPPAWVVGVGDDDRNESGSDEFRGQGFLVAHDGTSVHFRKGAPGIRLTGSNGEIRFDGIRDGWRWWQEVDVLGKRQRVEVPWPEPQFGFPYGAVYCLADVMDCLFGDLDEPKNSGRRVAAALEVEIALKQSSDSGGRRIDLPLGDRSLGLRYDWFR